MKAIITIEGVSKTKIVEKEFKKIRPFQAMFQEDNRIKQWVMKEYRKAVEGERDQYYYLKSIELMQ